MLTTITAFLVVSTGLQTSGIPATIKSQIPAAIGKSKEKVDNLFGKAEPWPNEQTLVCEGLVSFTYQVQGCQQIQVIFTKNLEKSVKFVFQFQDQSMATKDLVAAVGLSLSGPAKFAPYAEAKGLWTVSPVKELKKPWVMSVFNSSVDKAGYAANVTFYSELGFGYAADYELQECSAVEIVDVSTDYSK